MQLPDDTPGAEQENPAQFLIFLAGGTNLFQLMTEVFFFDVI